MWKRIQPSLPTGERGPFPGAVSAANRELQGAGTSGRSPPEGPGGSLKGKLLESGFFIIDWDHFVFDQERKLQDKDKLKCEAAEHTRMLVTMLLNSLYLFVFAIYFSFDGRPPHK